MFADDIALVRDMAAKYSAVGPFIECGGLEDPVVADYTLTILAMGQLGAGRASPGSPESYRQRVATSVAVQDAQFARYLKIHRPLEGSCPGYVCEDPGAGGLEIERLAERYDPNDGTGIGTAVLLSVLEHVRDPFHAIDRLRDAMVLGGLAIVSVPFIFPHHPSPEDNFRFTPTGLRHLFEAWPGEPARWAVLEADWRLDIPSEAGVLDIKTGRAQAIKSCFAVARAIG